MPDRPFLDVKGLARFLGVSTNVIYGWTARTGPDTIPRYKPGKVLLFDPAEVVAWIRKQRVGSETAERNGRGGRSPRSRSDSEGVSRQIGSPHHQRPSRNEAVALTSGSERENLARRQVQNRVGSWASAGAALKGEVCAQQPAGASRTRAGANGAGVGALQVPTGGPGQGEADRAD